jgi:hypothetical protein
MGIKGAPEAGCSIYVYAPALVQHLGLSYRGEEYPLYPLFHPTSVHCGQIAGFSVGPGMGHIKKDYAWSWSWDVRFPQQKIWHSLNSTVKRKVL